MKALAILLLLTVAAPCIGQSPYYGQQPNPPARRLLRFWAWLWAVAWISLAAFTPAHAKWYEYQPAGSIDGKGTLEEVLSRSTRGSYFRQKYANDLATMCHECTHDVSNRATLGFGPRIQAFYIGKGTMAVFREPGVRITDVAQRVPAQFRDGVYYQLYLVHQPSTQPILNDMPLYLLDEWVASINGARAAQELGVSDTGDLQMANQFCAYADALLATIGQMDPQYAELAELREFIDWEKDHVATLNNSPTRQPFVPRTNYAQEFFIRKQKPMQNYCGDCYGGQCYPSNNCWQPVTQLQPTRQVIAAPPRPSIIPSPSASDAKALLPWREEMERKIAALEAKQGTQGPAGPPGPPGPPGQPGAGTTINTTALAQSITQAVSAQLEGRLSALEAAQNKPFYMRVSPDSPYQEVKPGNYVTLPLEKLQTQ